MKQVNQLVAVLNRVMAIVFKLQKQPESLVSFAEVNELLKNHLSLSFEDMLAMQDKELIQKLVEEHHSTPDLVGQVGDLLFEVNKISGDIPYSREALLRKALYLYEYAEDADDTYSLDRHFRKEELINLLDES